MKLKISGHSDDIVSYELGKKADELSPPENNRGDDDGLFMGTLLVHSRKGRCVVHVVYDGCWSFAIGKADEEDPAPWAFSVTWDGYTQVIEADVPKGTKIEWRR